MGKPVALAALLVIPLSGCEKIASHIPSPEHYSDEPGCVLHHSPLAATPEAVREIKNSCREMFFAENKALAESGASWEFASEVSISDQDDRYPIFVIKSGYEALSQTPEGVLLGWTYQAINTSETPYLAEVSYMIEDDSGYTIASSSSSKWIAPKSIGDVKGTVTLDWEQVDRLPKQEEYRGVFASWTISLEPDWSSEGKTESSTRERASEIIASKYPWLVGIMPDWRKDSLRDTAKWGAIIERISPAEKQDPKKPKIVDPYEKPEPQQ